MSCGVLKRSMWIECTGWIVSLMPRACRAVVVFRTGQWVVGRKRMGREEREREREKEKGRKRREKRGEKR